MNLTTQKVIRVGLVGHCVPDSSHLTMAVTSAIPGAKVVRRAGGAPGVVVVVGDRFSAVGTGPKSITADGDATICSPTLS